MTGIRDSWVLSNIMEEYSVMTMPPANQKPLIPGGGAAKANFRFICLLLGNERNPLYCQSNSALGIAGDRFRGTRRETYTAVLLEVTRKGPGCQTIKWFGIGLIDGKGTVLQVPRILRLVSTLDIRPIS